MNQIACLENWDIDFTFAPDINLESVADSLKQKNIFMKQAYVFPGQGAQFSGMGKDLYEMNAEAKALFDKANEILGILGNLQSFYFTLFQVIQNFITNILLRIHCKVYKKLSITKMILCQLILQNKSI